jgi:SNF2 family DNA or RNA helicase
MAVSTEVVDDRSSLIVIRADASPTSNEEDRVEAFQSGQGDVFVVSLKAGGTGLNLTAADDVIHLDPGWNPAVEDQSSDRVYRMILAGTIEGK